MRPTWLLVCSFVVASGIALDAQWIKLPTPGLPRLPDGKPHLTAPAPRTTEGKLDLSGLWKNDGGDRFYIINYGWTAPKSGHRRKGRLHAWVAPLAFQGFK